MFLWSLQAWSLKVWLQPAVTHEELEPLKLHAVYSSSRFVVELFVDIAQGNCAACIVQKTSLRNAASLKLYSASFVEANVVCYLSMKSIWRSLHDRFTAAWSLERWCRFGFSFAEVDCIYDWSICSFWSKIKVFEAILKYLADAVSIWSWICCCRWLFEAVWVSGWLQANAEVDMCN